MRKIIIAGNWKMYKTLKEGQELVVALRRELFQIENIDIVVCPPFTLLAYIADALETSNILVGAQDVFWETEGAFTGEVSCKMLLDAECKFVIIGHSERRQYFAETNETVNKKIKTALKYDLTPIVCVGERLEERQAGKTFQVVENHVKNGLKDIPKEELTRVVIAYEPVWAIGTGLTAKPEQAQEVHAFIRKLLTEISDKETAQDITIQYGGSVKPDNIKDLMREKDIDGALVGGASLKVDSFVEIVKSSSEIVKEKQ